MLLTPSGGRLWRVRYHHRGVEKLLTLGAYPDISLKRAREKRDDTRKLLAEGVGPNVKKRPDREQQRNSFGAVAQEWLERSLHTSLCGRASFARLNGGSLICRLLSDAFRASA
jgi:hypothetical protein